MAAGAGADAGADAGAAAPIAIGFGLGAWKLLKHYQNAPIRNPFDKVGLPMLPTEGVPTVAYTVQEGLYKGFIAPVALYGVLAAVMLRNRRSGGGEEQ